MDLATRIFLLLMALGQHTVDRGHETEPERRARLDLTAQLIVWRTDDPQEAAILLTIGSRETRFAWYVGSGNCHLGKPFGMDCDGGLAASYWQLTKWAGPHTLAAEPGSVDQLSWAIHETLVYWRRGYDKCRQSVNGAFAFYKGRACDHPDGRARGNLYRKILCQLTVPWERQGECRLGQSTLPRSP